MSRCNNMLDPGPGILGSIQCFREAAPQERYCKVCLAAKKRGEARSEKYRKENEARWAKREAADKEAAEREAAIREFVAAWDAWDRYENDDAAWCPKAKTQRESDREFQKLLSKQATLREALDGARERLRKAGL